MSLANFVHNTTKLSETSHQTMSRRGKHYRLSAFIKDFVHSVCLLLLMILPMFIRRSRNTYITTMKSNFEKMINHGVCHFLPLRWHWSAHIQLLLLHTVLAPSCFVLAAFQVHGGGRDCKD